MVTIHGQINKHTYTYAKFIIPISYHLKNSNIHLIWRSFSSELEMIWFSIASMKPLSTESICVMGTVFRKERKNGRLSDVPSWNGKPREVRHGVRCLCYVRGAWSAKEFFM
jgi:hypothetical protein